MRNAFVLSKIRIPKVWEIRDSPASEGLSGDTTQEDPETMPQVQGLLSCHLGSHSAGQDYFSFLIYLLSSFLTLCHSKTLLRGCILAGLFVVWGINFFLVSLFFMV